MEYTKMIIFLDNTPNEPSNSKTKNWIEINDASRGIYDKDNQIRFKTSVLRLSLCDYSNPHILVNGTITVRNTAAQGQASNGANKKGNI